MLMTDGTVSGVERDEKMTRHYDELAAKSMDTIILAKFIIMAMVWKGMQRWLGTTMS